MRRCFSGGQAGHAARFTFRALKELSDPLAGVPAAGGLQRGGLLDVLLAAWHYGIPVVGYKGDGPFDPERAHNFSPSYVKRKKNF